MNNPKNQKEQGWTGHPKPQMKRKNYMILNEGWILNGHAIKLPFVPQSELSGYDGEVTEHMTYEVSFLIPDSFQKERVLLHFGAVDQIAEIWINDSYVGKHEGGYNSFSFDVTDVVKKEQENKMRIEVTDELSPLYPYGKQRKKRGGMWYTPVSGIWQPVWLENVPAGYIKDVVIKPDLEGVYLQIRTGENPCGTGEGCEQKKCTEYKVTVTLDNGEQLTQVLCKKDGYLKLTDHVCQNGETYIPKLWTPDVPYLYHMNIATGEDEVETYFALRTIDIQEIEGIKRVCLNGKPIFMHGVLDQGYFQEGIFLPAEPEEYERDVLRMKELGFNMLRKHIKIEPECFYYYCDKHGMLVMQDMINSGNYSFIRNTVLPTIGFKKRRDSRKGDAERKRIFKGHMEQTIHQLYNHPCIVAYTIFNEGWGQFDSDDMYDCAKSLDDSRLFDSTSGWFWQTKNDFDSEHIYFKTIDLKVGERPLFVTECGGFSRAIDGHLYNSQKTYGYGRAESERQLTDMIENMYRKMILPGIPKGVCGCIYTQLSDIEDEINGFYTYDRQVCKVDKEAIKKLSEELKAKPGKW